MAASTSYNNDKAMVSTGELEYPADPASGAIFQPDYKKHEDLKQMLDGSKDSLKLEAMKRIIGMIAKGRDASDLFPAVVKNVVSKNIEVKKLVYVYLVRYAEEQQDLALLSISTFQRALKDPNQLIRASALRVLSSIRVAMIVPIVMLAIRDSSSDMSPYVRKTAAHAIPKLYTLDPEQKEDLVLVIQKLLSDKSPLVVGSAAMAFMEVCPDRMSLIHACYNKLCALLVDVDEWGQLVLLNMLTRYVRENFCDPDQDGQTEPEDEQFYDSESDNTGRPDAPEKKQSVVLDPAHRLLLRAASPLLQSRNAGVVMAVAQLFYHAGPAADLPQAGKALVRLLRGPYEVQSVVLHSIASLTIHKKSMFEPYLKSFFVRNSDPTHVKLLKLEILTNLATETSVSIILRELQTYVTSNDKTFVAAAIQSIGRLAATIEEVTETCLKGLLQLLSSRDAHVVGEAVVVVRRVLRAVGGRCDPRWAVRRAARLLLAARLPAPAARAAALWLVAEHSAAASHAPAAVLAHFAATFSDEDELVKLQVLTLGVKLLLRRSDVSGVVAYVMSQARYDASYDVRDRARLLHALAAPHMREHAHYVLAAEKPVPLMESKFTDRQQYTLGSLSHYVGVKALGYTPLPPYQREVLHSALRDTPQQQYDTKTTDTRSSATTPHVKADKKVKKESFYSADESSDSSSSESDSTSTNNESEKEAEDTKSDRHTRNVMSYDSKWSSNEESGSGSGSGSSSDSDSDDSSSSSDTSSDSDSDESGDDEKRAPAPAPAVPNHSGKKKVDNNIDSSKTKEAAVNKNSHKPKSNLELLLELDEVASSLPTMTPSYGGYFSPGNTPTENVKEMSVVEVEASVVESVGRTLLSRVEGRGLCVDYRYTRRPNLFQPRMITLELTLRNTTDDDITNVRISQKHVSGEQEIQDFVPVSLSPGAELYVTMGANFADTTQALAFTLASSAGEHRVSIKPPVGELVRGVSMESAKWVAEQKLRKGLAECTGVSASPGNTDEMCRRVLKAANVAVVSTPGEGNCVRFAGQTAFAHCLVLICVEVREGEDDTHITVNCDNMAIGSMLLNQIKQAFTM